MKIQSINMKDAPIYWSRANEIFWVFLISGIIGVIIENIFCIIKFGRFEDRASVLYSPFNIVYALGGLAFVLATYVFNPKRDIYLFLAFTIIGGGIEYFVSFIQEAILNSVSWDYSGFMFNIDGRTYLFYDLIWALIGVFYVKDIYPFIKNFASKMRTKIGVIVTWILIIILLSDNALTLGAELRSKQRLNNDPASNGIERFFDKYYDDEYLKKKFPNMIIKY